MRCEACPVCPDCDGDGTEPCPVCNADKWLSDDCDWCDHGLDSCGLCDGTGEIPCEACAEKEE